MDLKTILDPIHYMEMESEEVDTNKFSDEWKLKHPNSYWFAKYGDECDLRLALVSGGKYMVYDHDNITPMFTLSPTMTAGSGDADRPPSKVFRFQGRAFDVEYYHDGSPSMVREIDS